MRRVWVVVALVVGGLVPTSASRSASSLAAAHTLLVDGMRQPVGVGPDDITFSWEGGPAHVRVYTKAGPIWDSGLVSSPLVYAGPPLAAHTVYLWTAGDSASEPFETALRDSDWAAKWIARPTSDVPQYTFARTSFDVADRPIARVRAYVAADQQYELWVNGRLAGKGQAYGYPDSQFYETLDITGLVHAGANGAGVLYMNAGATKGHPAGIPGFIALITVIYADGTALRVGSSPLWQVAAGNWLASTQRDLEGDQVDYKENIDGLTYPTGWSSSGFSPSPLTWSTPIVLPPRHMIPSRNRVTYTPITPTVIHHLPDGSVVADFGQVFAAIPVVSFTSPAPVVVPMRAGYLLDSDGSVSTSHGTQHTDMSYSYVAPAGTSVFRPFDYLAFRYFQVSPGAASVSSITIWARHADMGVSPPATFSSSNPTLDAIWRLGQHSALYVAQEYFVDTPTREKGPWLWDGFNSSQTTMAAFGESNLTRASLLLFAQSQSRYWPTSGRINKIYPTGLGAVDINEFSEIYPEWVWQYWLDTGDKALLASVYPTLLRLSDYVWHYVSPTTGLVTWPPATSIYYPYAVVTRLNILGVNVFRHTADVAAVLGVPPGASPQRASALAAAINHSLVGRDGLYVDGLYNGGTAAGPTQAANICALAYDVAPPSAVARIGSYVAAQGMAVPPRLGGELIAALRAAGRDVVPLLTNPHIDGWAQILARGGTFTWEVWQPSDANGDSMSHGWGSNVLVEINRTVLGVTPTSGGYATFDVRPSGSVASASGTIPTPHGVIGVVRSGSTVTLDVPSGTTARVETVGGSLTLGAGHHVVDHAVGN